MKHRIFFLLLIVACSGCLGGGEEGGNSPAISQVELAKGPFTPPADGKLTAELVDHLLLTYDETRAQLIGDGNGALCSPDWSGDSGAKKRRARTLSTARSRAQMAVGMNNAKWFWLQKALKEARIFGRTGRGGAAAKANHEFLKGYEEELAKAQEGLK